MTNRTAIRFAARLAVTLGCLAALSAAGRDAAANGAYSHIHISQLAVEALPPGPVKDLLGDPDIAAACEAGSMFPDSGYVADDYYGEAAHWPEFQNAYLAFLREKWGGEYATPEARAEAAFLLGDMSHGLADQVYDYTLLDRALEIDGSGEVSADELGDYFIVVDDGVLLDTRAWGPYEDLAGVFTDHVDHTVDAGTLERGMRGMQSVIFVQRTVARGRYLTAWQTYPFLGTHVYNPAAPGSLPHLGTIVALHWQAAWRRLRGEATMDTDLIVTTLPPDGAVNHPVDAATDGTAYVRVGIVFAWGVRRSQVTPLLSLRGPDGEPVDVRVRTPYGRGIANYVMLEPRAPLAYDTEYTIEVAPGVQNLDGAANTVLYTSTFRTRCAPERLDDCPPLPEPLVTGEIPTEVPPEPGPDVVEPDPDVVEPGPDVVEPGQDIVEPGPDAVDPIDASTDAPTADVATGDDAVAPTLDTASADVAGRDDGPATESDTTTADGGGTGGGCALDGGGSGSTPAGALALLLALLALLRAPGRVRARSPARRAVPARPTPVRRPVRRPI